MFMYLAALFLCFSYRSFLRTDPKYIFEGQNQNGVTTNGNILSCLSFCLLQIFLVCFQYSCREKTALYWREYHLRAIIPQRSYFPLLLSL